MIEGPNHHSVGESESCTAYGKWQFVSTALHKSFPNAFDDSDGFQSQGVSVSTLFTPHVSSSSSGPVARADDIHTSTTATTRPTRGDVTGPPSQQRIAYTYGIPTFSYPPFPSSHVATSRLKSSMHTLIPLRMRCGCEASSVAYQMCIEQRHSRDKICGCPALPGLLHHRAKFPQVQVQV